MTPLRIPFIEPLGLTSVARPRITGILVSHFLLDLQSTNRVVMHLDSASGEGMDTIIFGRAVFTLESATNYSDPTRSFKDLVGGSDLKGMDSDWSSTYSDVRGVPVDLVAEERDIEGGAVVRS